MVTEHSSHATQTDVLPQGQMVRHMQRRVEELERLYEFSRSIVRVLDLDQVLVGVAREVTSLVGAERVSIFLVDESTRELVLGNCIGGQEAIRLSPPWPGIVGWIARHGAPVIANDVQGDPRFVPDVDISDKSNTHAILGAPLKHNDQVIGVIHTQNKFDGSFTENDRNLLVDFCDWASIALRNAQLHTNLRKNKERLASAEAVAIMGDTALSLAQLLTSQISVARDHARNIQASCAHELRNPYLAAQVQEIGQVTAECLTALHCIRHLFEPAETTPVNVLECLAQAISRVQIAPGVKVVERHQPDLPPVMATCEKLIGTFSHVISNALDAMGEKGQLWLSTRRRLDGMVEVVVSDDGPGMSPEAQKQLLELGFTTKNAEVGGLGWGLWWTHVYVSQLGGQLAVRSTPAQGTVVSLRLPAGQNVPY